MRWLLLAFLMCIATIRATAEGPFVLLGNDNVLLPLELVAPFCGATVKQGAGGRIDIYQEGKLRGELFAHPSQGILWNGDCTLDGVHFVALRFITGCVRAEFTWDPVARVATVRNPVTKQELVLPCAGVICTAKEPIFAAIQANDVPTATRILQQHPEQAMASFRTGNHPLNWAVKLASPEMVTLLLKAGADPNITKETGSTPLLDAIDLHNLPMAALLLENHADPNIGILTSRPLVQAVHAKNTALVELLLDHGANVNYTDAITPPALFIACSDMGNLQIIELLLNKGADPNLVHKISGYTPILSAVADKNLAVAEYLLAHGADPNIKSARGRTALAIAVMNKDQAMIKLLTTNMAARNHFVSSD